MKCTIFNKIWREDKYIKKKKRRRIFPFNLPNAKEMCLLNARMMELNFKFDKLNTMTVSFSPFHLSPRVPNALTNSPTFFMPGRQVESRGWSWKRGYERIYIRWFLKFSVKYTSWVKNQWINQVEKRGERENSGAEARQLSIWDVWDSREIMGRNWRVRSQKLNWFDRASPFNGRIA